MTVRTCFLRCDRCHTERRGSPEFTEAQPLVESARRAGWYVTSVHLCGICRRFVDGAEVRPDAPKPQNPALWALSWRDD